jgi:hypothetical protein
MTSNFFKSMAYLDVCSGRNSKSVRKNVNKSSKREGGKKKEENT